MIEKLLREFAEENFGEDSKYFPVSHGRTQEIIPFVLMVKQPRSIWERPLKPYKYTTLARLDKYVVKSKEQDFLETLNLHIVKDDTDLVLEEDEEEDGEGASR